MTRTQSTTAVVSNVGAVCALLNTYVLDVQAEVKADEGGVKGTIRFADEDGCPAAVPRDVLPDPEDGRPQDYEEAVSQLLETQGEECFARLLLALSPHLETPLAVLALLRAAGTSRARTWRVQPDGEKPA